MMPLYAPIAHLFGQLQWAVDALDPEDYTRPSRQLSGATIGQHLRHIIELYAVLLQGYPQAQVNYEKRKRDKDLETQPALALQQLEHLLQELQQADKKLIVHTDLPEHAPIIVGSSYYRELLFNIEHTVHHMALIRVGIQEHTHIVLPGSFGVGASTLKYQQRLCVQ